MRDSDVRGALATRLAHEAGTSEHLLAHEVDIRWTVPARMDLLYVADRVTGFEIKSDVDSLSRLNRQVGAYNHVVELAYAVVAQRHVEHVMAVVPSWWGVWRATQAAGHPVDLTEIRRARLNPDLSPLAMTTFLTRPALLAALREVGERNLSSLRVDELRALVVDRYGKRQTVNLVREVLRASGGAHPGQPAQGAKGDGRAIGVASC